MNILQGAKGALILNFMQMAYQSVLRDLLKQAVERTDNTLDDYILDVMDRVFDYKE